MGHPGHLRTVVLLGASGLVGGQALQRLLAHPQVGRVVAPGRRPLGITHPKLHQELVDYEHLPADAAWWRADALVCALGTTRAQAGSAAGLRRVDHDYPLLAADLARRAGTDCCVLVSATGANARSPVFYHRVKGELEVALRARNWRSLVLVRPGLIGGQRAQRRPAEHAASVVLGVLHPLLPRRWRISPAGNIADVLVNAALRQPPGQSVVSAAELA